MNGHEPRGGTTLIDKSVEIPCKREEKRKKAESRGKERNYLLKLSISFKFYYSRYIFDFSKFLTNKTEVIQY